MFGSLGFGEILLIVIVALVVIGPDKLPSVARQVGKGLAELRKVSNELRFQLMSGVDEVEKSAAPAPPRARPIIRPAPGAHANRVDPLTADTNPDAPEPSVAPVEAAATPAEPPQIAVETTTSKRTQGEPTV